MVIQAGADLDGRSGYETDWKIVISRILLRTLVIC